MAVNLYEAWGVPHPNAEKTGNVSTTNAPVVSAKNVQMIERELATSSIRGELQPDVTNVVESETENKILKQILKHMEGFAEEMVAVRNDQVRRTMVYLSVVGIFFAVLIMYIERLNRQISNLNNILHLHQWSSSNLRTL